MPLYTGSLKGILKQIEALMNVVRNEGLVFDRTRVTDNILRTLAQYLGVDESAALLFCLFFDSYLYEEERPVSLWHLRGDIYHLAQCYDDVQKLVDAGLLEENNEMRGSANAEFCKCSFYVVKKSVLNAILHNKPISTYSDGSGYNADTRLILPEKIKYKELFFMPEVALDIERIKEALMPANFHRIQAQMEQKKTAGGISIMFYGAPGTGKTESVLQLAKSCNRAVFQVETGAIISKWVGETENNIYKAFCAYEKECEIAKKYNRLEPILFFNEADGLFGKRILNPTRGELTENKVQAIMLDRMERMEGILIATTNIEDNFDTAYERRFLFKVKFSKPNSEVKKKIWTNKLDWLGDALAQKLAEKYDFSGGEIDNIVRKVAMDEVIKGERTSFETLEEYCRNEKLHSGDRRQIGF